MSEMHSERPYEDSHNTDYYTEQQLSKIVSRIDEKGHKLYKKLTHAVCQRELNLQMEVREKGISVFSEELQKAFTVFGKKWDLMGKSMFPVRGTLPLQEEHALTPNQLTSVSHTYKNTLKSYIPNIQHCSELDLWDVFTRVDVEAIVALISDIWVKMVQQETGDVLSKEDALILMAHIYRNFFVRYTAFIAMLESDKERFPSLNVLPNTPKFTTQQQTLEMVLQHISVITHSKEEHTTGAVTITDILNAKKYVTDFAKASALRSDPLHQNVHIVFLSNKQEEAMRHFISQKIATEITELEWAHDDYDDPEFVVTELLLDELVKLGFSREQVSVYHVRKENVIEEDGDYVAITVDPETGLYIDIVKKNEDDPMTVLEISL